MPFVLLCCLQLQIVSLTMANFSLAIPFQRKSQLALTCVSDNDVFEQVRVGHV